MNGYIKAVGGILFSVIFLYLSIRDVNLESVLNSADQIRYIWIPMGFTLLLTSLCLRAVRWKQILGGIDEFDTTRLFQYNTFGWALNFILPAKGGELAKGVVSARHESQPIAFMTGSIVVARLLDLLALLLFLVIGVLYLQVRLPEYVPLVGVGLILLVCSGIGSVWLVNRNADRIPASFSKRPILRRLALRTSTSGQDANRIPIANGRLSIMRSRGQVKLCTRKMSRERTSAVTA